MIDYNSYLVNIFLRDVTDNVTKFLAEEEDKFKPILPFSQEIFAVIM